MRTVGRLTRVGTRRQRDPVLPADPGSERTELSALASVASACAAWYAIARRSCFAMLATGLLMSMASPANAADVGLTANEWRTFPADVRGWYVLGVVDGVRDMATYERRANSESPAESSLLARVAKGLNQCVGGRMTRGQTIAIVEKYITGHPEEWHPFDASTRIDSPGRSVSPVEGAMAAAVRTGD
jgi:hypothetical protein